LQFRNTFERVLPAGPQTFFPHQLDKFEDRQLFSVFFFLLPVCHRQKKKKTNNGATLPLKNATENTSNFGRLLVGRLHNTSSSNLAQAMAKANRRHCGPRSNPT